MTIGIWQLIIIVLLVLVLFGSGKLRSLGSDLAQSLKGFKKAMQEDEQPDTKQDTRLPPSSSVDADFTADEAATKKTTNDHTKE